VRLEASIEIDAPPEAVWPIATNPNLAPQWNSNIVRVVYDGNGEVHAGTTWIQVLRVLGREETMRGEVVECDPPHRGVVRFQGPGDPVVTTTIGSEGSGSILHQVMDLTIPAGLTGMALRVGVPMIKEQLHEALRRQKAAAETSQSSERI